MKNLFVYFVLLNTAFLASVARGNEEQKEVSDPLVRYVLEDGRVFAVSETGRNEMQLPSSAQAIYQHGDELYVALETQVVAIYSLSAGKTPKLKKTVPTPRGRVSRFFMVDDQVWVRLETTTGMPLEGSFERTFKSTTSVPRTETVALAQAEKRADVGKRDSSTPQLVGLEHPIRIEKIFRGEATLNVGAKNEVKVNDRFTVFREYKVQKHGVRQFTGKKQVAVLTVVALDDEHSLATLSRGDRVRLDDHVEPYEPNDRQHRVYPRRLENLGEVSTVLRPILNVSGNGIGFGGLVDLTASWWGNYYFCGLRIQPLGFGWTDDGALASSSILGEVGYDSRPFAVGIGAGVGIVSGNIDEMMASESHWNNEDNSISETRAAFALSQTARLGARDGLNLTVYNHFLYYDDESADNDEDDTGFIYGGTFARINIPLSEDLDLFLRGGGARIGYGFGEVGVFAWIVGRGDGGSWGLSAATGGAGVWMKETRDRYTTRRTTVAGPLVSFGVAHRFGG